jgi:hypothetical protein
VLFIQRDQVIEDLAATTSDPFFGGSVLPWRLYARPFSRPGLLVTGPSPHSQTFTDFSLQRPGN